MPTHGAVLARYWIEEHSPDPGSDACEDTCFALACSKLGRDVVVERGRLLAEIDAAWRRVSVEYCRAITYQQRAAVLTCAGIPTAIGKQYVLPLVAAADYEDVAGIDRSDPPSSDTRKRKQRQSRQR